jgi:protein-S-isoprenylcysteine O-methyltransferase Ste14
MALQEEMEKQGLWLFRYRGSIPLIIFFIGFAVFLYSELHPEFFLIKNLLPTTLLEIGCVSLSLFGLFIRIYAVGHTPKNTSGRNVGRQLAESLNSTGIYSMVRHPLYLGNFFMWLGPAAMTGSIWFIAAFVLFYWVYYERIMFAEEQFLRRKFEQIYLDWSDKTPAFWPSFKNFVKPALPFSWKKILKKEKNGLAAIFVIFCVFDLASNLVQGSREFNPVWIWLAGVSIIIYLILKVLKSHSRLLNEEGR